MHNRKNKGSAETAVLAYIAIFLICAGAWLTHLYTCFTEEQWGFLIGGAIFFPIAIFHGIGLWFGVW